MRCTPLICLVVAAGCGESHDSQGPQVVRDAPANESTSAAEESSLDLRNLGMQMGAGAAEIAFRFDDEEEQKLSASLRLDVTEGQELTVLTAYANDGMRSVYVRLLAPLGEPLLGQQFALGFPSLDNSSVALLVGPQLDATEINFSMSGEAEIEALVDARATLRFTAELARQDGSTRAIDGTISGKVALLCSLIDRRSDAGGYLIADGTEGSSSLVSDDSLTHPLCQQAAAMLAIE